MKYVYVMRVSGDRYKVGVAYSVSKRLEALQTSNPEMVELVAARLVKNPEQIERKLHRLLVDRKIGNGNREWFQLEPRHVIETLVLLNKEPEVDVADAIVEHIRKNITSAILKYETMIDEKIKAQRMAEKLVVDESPEKEIKKIFTPTFDDETSRAKTIILNEGKASTSLLQRRMQIGYGKAARIMDTLEQDGFIGPLDGIKREILYTL